MIFLTLGNLTSIWKKFSNRFALSIWWDIFQSFIKVSVPKKRILRANICLKQYGKLLWEDLILKFYIQKPNHLLKAYRNQENYCKGKVFQQSRFGIFSDNKLFWKTTKSPFSTEGKSGANIKLNVWYKKGKIEMTIELQKHWINFFQKCYFQLNYNMKIHLLLTGFPY